MAAPIGTSSPDAFVEITPPGDRSGPVLTVEVDPMATVLTSIVESFGPLAHRVPPLELKQARAAARHTPVPLLLHLTVGGASDLYSPDFLRGVGSASTFEQQVEALRETPPEILAQDLDSLRAQNRGSAMPWLRDPGRVLAAYCAALLAYWREVVSPLHPDLHRHLRREAARLEVGLEEYGADVLLGLLHPRLSAENGRLRLHGGHYSGVTPWRADTLVLKPMVCAAPTYFSNIGAADNPRVRTAFFAAATPALRQGRAAEAEPDNGVDLLIGRPRAEILRSLRRRPGTTTELAAELRLTPSTVSYHLKALSTAGVTGMSRHGARVYYRITDDGLRLLDIGRTSAD